MEVRLERSDLDQQEVFDILMSDASTKDIRVVCSDGIVPAHRVVLATASSFLRTLLESPNSDTIHLPDFSASVVQHWLHLVYVGELVVNSPDMLHLGALVSLMGVTKDGKEWKGFQEDRREDEDEEGYQNGEEYEVEQVEVQQRYGMVQAELGDDDDDDDDDEDEDAMDGIGDGDMDEDDERRREEDGSPDLVGMVECNLDTLENGGGASSSSTSAAYQCHSCSHSFDDREQLELHVKRTHSGPGEYRCPHCTVTFHDRHSLTIHRREHKRGDRLISCPICGKTSTEASIRRHILLHGGAAARRHFVPFTCKICGRAFPKSQVLASHVKREHRLASVKLDAEKKPRIQLFMQKRTDETKEWAVMAPQAGDPSTVEAPRLACLLCDDKFVSEAERREHKTEVHMNATYTCIQCGQSFDSELAYHKHATLHREEGATTDCMVCERRYQTRRGFLHHVPSHHTDEAAPRRKQSPVACRVCGARFASHRQLQQHNLSHPFHYPYQCNVCKYVYPSSQLLQSHDCPRRGSMPTPPQPKAKAKPQPPPPPPPALKPAPSKSKFTAIAKGLTLQPIPPHFCLICHEQFPNDPEYQMHRRGHPQGSLHKCDVCLRGFRSPSQCLEHRTFHSNDKQYQCPFCPKSFHVHRFLGYHLRDHHQQDQQQSAA